MEFIWRISILYVSTSLPEPSLVDIDAHDGRAVRSFPGRPALFHAVSLATIACTLAQSRPRPCAAPRAVGPAKALDVRERDHDEHEHRRAQGRCHAELPRELLREAGVRAGASEDREDHDGQEERQHGEQHRAAVAAASATVAVCTPMRSPPRRSPRTRASIRSRTFLPPPRWPSCGVRAENPMRQTNYPSPPTPASPSIHGCQSVQPGCLQQQAFWCCALGLARAEAREVEHGLV
eukprot:scaffold86391_cov60-Phaeocystis_antarctica.AAC.3